MTDKGKLLDALYKASTAVELEGGYIAVLIDPEDAVTVTQDYYQVKKRKVLSLSDEEAELVKDALTEAYPPFNHEGMLLATAILQRLEAQ